MTKYELQRDAIAFVRESLSAARRPLFSAELQQQGVGPFKMPLAHYGIKFDLSATIRDASSVYASGQVSGLADVYCMSVDIVTQGTICAKRWDVSSVDSALVHAVDSFPEIIILFDATLSNGLPASESFFYSDGRKAYAKRGIAF
jgi:hypothetical protein